MKRFILTVASLLLMGPLAGTAQAAKGISDGVVKIGVLSDMSGVYKSLEGPGATVAARMAIQDFGGKVLGKPIKLVSADHQNKADVGSSIARQWFDQDHVDMITALDNSAVALAVQRLATEKHRLIIDTGAGSTQLTEKDCSPYGIHYVYDTHATPVGTATAIVKNGGKKWYFITADYAFGHSLQKNTSEVVRGLGGTVVGSVQAPLSTNDFSSYLMQAQASGAQVIGLANAGADTVNAIRQAHEFGIVKGGQSIAGMLVFITDIKAMGLDIAQGTQFTTAFYWDRNAQTRAWSKRFFKRHHAMPTMVQAGTYSAVTNYLKAIRAAGTDDAAAVRAQLGKMTLNDFFVHNGHIEPNGLMLHDMYLVKAKKPSQSKSPWDLLTVESTIPGKKAFIPLSKSACPLLHHS